MPKKLGVRAVTETEKAAINELVRSRTAEARLVQRAKVIAALLENPQLGAGPAGQQAGFEHSNSGRLWVKRFNERGLAGLQDGARPGRPVVHTQQVRSALIALAVQKPGTLGYPFALWTLERLQRAYQQRHKLHLSDSTIWEWLKAEGLDWKHQQSWFHDAEHHDPQFVEKRGP